MNIRLSRAIDGFTVTRQVAGYSDHTSVRLHPSHTLR